MAIARTPWLLCIVMACGATPRVAQEPTTAAAGSASAVPSSTGPSASGNTAAPGPVGARLTGFFNLDQCSTIKGNAEAMAAFTKGCDAGDAEGCFDLSIRYQCGVGVAADPAKAASLSARSCDLGGALACGNAATGYGMGDLADPPKAFKYATRGCELHDPTSCAYVGVFYWQGIGVAPDPARAAGLLDGQCQKSFMMACANLAVLLYMGGNGVPRDLPRARTVAERACAAEMDAACNIIGAIALEQGGDDNVEVAVAKFGQVCARGGGASCDNLGQLYLHGVGKIAPDSAKAKAQFQRACDLKNALGCTHLGELEASP